MSVNALQWGIDGAGLRPHCTTSVVFHEASSVRPVRRGAIKIFVNRLKLSTESHGLLPWELFYDKQLPPLA